MSHYDLIVLGSGAGDFKAQMHMTLDHEVDVLEHQFNRVPIPEEYKVKRT